MLVKKVSFFDFVEEFRRYGREGQFSYEGLKALFEYLEELAEDLGSPIELDVVGICCDFTEYSCLEEFIDDYSYSIGDDINSLDDIQDYTTVIKIDDNRFIIQDF